MEGPTRWIIALTLICISKRTASVCSTSVMFRFIATCAPALFRLLLSLLLSLLHRLEKKFPICVVIEEAGKLSTRIRRYHTMFAGIRLRWTGRHHSAFISNDLSCRFGWNLCFIGLCHQITVNAIDISHAVNPFSSCFFLTICHVLSLQRSFHLGIASQRPVLPWRS